MKFDLSSYAVARGIEEKRLKEQQMGAMNDLRTRSLLASCGDAFCTEPEHHKQPATRLSMRFVPPPSKQEMSVSPLSFATLVLPRAPNPVPMATTKTAAPVPKSTAAPEYDECVEVDQYTVDASANRDAPRQGCSRFWQLVYAVLVSNAVDENVPEAQRKKRSPFLGPTGHLERFSARTHLVGTVLFMGYAIYRHTFAHDTTTSGVLTSLASWAIVGTFLSSTIYHSTAPDETFAFFTRQLDFTSIYISIVLAAVCDLSIATRGFQNTPIVSLIDVPFAASIVCVFFLWRRYKIPSEETWMERRSRQCTIGTGLFSKGHFDIAHQPLREATSLLISMAYFLVIPAAIATLGGEVAAVALGLQISSFVVIVLGMVLDHVVRMPDEHILKTGDAGWAAMPSCGCILNAHGWHVHPFEPHNLTHKHTHHD